MPDRETPSAHAEPDGIFIDVSVLTDDGWTDSAGIDPRGYTWRPPGTYIIAAWSDTGRQLAEVKVDYVFSASGDDKSEQIITAISTSLNNLYHPQARTT